MKSAAAVAGIFFGLASLACPAEGVNIGGTRRARTAAQAIVRMDFKYTLRICNAYPQSSSLDAFMQHGAVKLNIKPLPYKACEDFAPPIRAGDRIEFQNGSMKMGTFTIEDLPSSDAVLMLLVSRHDVKSPMVSFQSHVFTESSMTQVAVFDAYRGGRTSDLWVQSLPSGVHLPANFSLNASHAEQLRFNSVVAIEPGSYDVVLHEGLVAKRTNISNVTGAEFVALPKQTYVLFRCGVEAEGGPVFPEELVVFPHSSPSGSSGLQPLRALLGALVGYMVFGGMALA